MVDSLYRPPNKGVSLWNWKVNYPRLRIPLGTTPKLLSFWAVILTQGGIDWETGLVPDDSPIRLLKEKKLIEVISEAGLQQVQRKPTRGQHLLDLSCFNKPSLVNACISIPGISDNSIVLADCDLKATINKKPQRKVYQWSKADWQLIKEQTEILLNHF